MTAVSPFVSRAEAGLVAPRATSTIRPVHLTAHWAGPSPWGSAGIGDHNRCATIWRGFQSFHMNTRGWYDIAYTSGVCPHGYRFEGRGRGVRTAANGTDAGNDSSHGVCYIAGVGDPFTDEAKLGFIGEAIRLATGVDRVHSDWKSTTCPGDEIRTWVRAGGPLPNFPDLGNLDTPVFAPPPAPVSDVDLVAIAALVRSAKARTWRRGDRGAGVLVIQNAINGISGRGLQVDGVFGAATDRAVRDLQRWFRLHVDGIVGPRTWSVLVPG